MCGLSTCVPCHIAVWLPLGIFWENLSAQISSHILWLVKNMCETRFLSSSNRHLINPMCVPERFCKYPRPFRYTNISCWYIVLFTSTSGIMPLGVSVPKNSCCFIDENLAKDAHNGNLLSNLLYSRNEKTRIQVGQLIIHALNSFVMWNLLVIWVLRLEAIFKLTSYTDNCQSSAIPCHVTHNNTAQNPAKLFHRHKECNPQLKLHLSVQTSSSIWMRLEIYFHVSDSLIQVCIINLDRIYIETGATYWLCHCTPAYRATSLWRTEKFFIYDIKQDKQTAERKKDRKKEHFSYMI